jgi:hypothetical protein
MRLKYGLFRRFNPENYENSLFSAHSAFRAYCVGDRFAGECLHRQHSNQVGRGQSQRSNCEWGGSPTATWFGWASDVVVTSKYLPSYCAWRRAIEHDGERFTLTSSVILRGLSRALPHLSAVICHSR